MADWQKQMLAQALIGPREGKLTPPDENAFQAFMAFDPNVRQWRNSFQNSFGETPIIEGGNYNYRKAWQAGEAPTAVASDSIPHWGSAGKAPDHPTAWKQDFVSNFGVDPDEQAQIGFSQPQSQMVNDQLSRDLLAKLLKGVMP